MGATHKWRGPEVMAQLRKNVRDAVARSGVTLQTEMKFMLSRPGSACHYGGNPTRSSAPGEPPAAQTEHLRGSVQLDPTGLVEQAPRVRVGTNVDYGKYLELGTLHIAARPWARPASTLARPKIKQLFNARALLRGIR